MTNVLLHSPLLGPTGTWGTVPEHLAGQCVVPDVTDDTAPSHAQRYARSVARQAGGLGAVRMVAYSGAGPLVAAVIESLAEHGTRATSVAFVDAGLPLPGSSRLEALRNEDADLADHFESILAAGQSYPDWTRSQLEALSPDPDLVLSAMRPRGDAFWRERLPAVDLPADVATGYVQLSAAYATYAAIARDRGWPIATTDLGHFGMLVDPQQVAGLIDEVAQGATTIS